ncbi:Lrp/AsnC family transcriptional regulator [Microaerobacter geothermalis]|uniref:Lrp/AsnC family transcriptional regulator n=1 Tax=Microaerobacter geothermalis TaxID=674972 RepID=UPI001F419DA3|nr:Lrp/AsnC family transcriptional regulator [Microaerobacter geothermalis]MCF6092474.1 Lrp/AsnC family transcriptional regulator [Microaerobacter geothermalis]
MEKGKIKELLRILEENSRLEPQVLSEMLDLPLDEVKFTVEKLEQSGIILKYSSIINWDKVEENDHITAMIDVKVTPKREVGFDDIARRIYRFPEVKSVYLMSGAYDLSVVIEGVTMKEVAQFVSEKLSTLDSVISTTTHFILKKYKHDGVIFDDREDDKRMVVTP